MYPIVYFDALRLKIRDEGTVKNKAVYLALGIHADGRKEVLGLWIEQTEGAKFWLKVFNELKNRGLDDILIAVVDGLRGFPEAFEAVYPQVQIQTCIVHLIRNSTTLAAWKDRKELAAALKPIYHAANADLAEAALDAFAAGPWGTKFPTVAAIWRRQWQQVTPFFAYPPKCARLSTRPMPSKACICACERSSRIAATSRATRRRPNYYSWPCATSRTIGRCRSVPGSRKQTGSLSCSASALRTRLFNYEFWPYTQNF